jgi:maltoporin
LCHSAYGDESVDALKRELELLKEQVKQYAQTSAALEGRLKALEEESATEKKVIEEEVRKEEEELAKVQKPEMETAEIAQTTPEVAKIAEKTQVEFLKKIALKAATDSQQVLFKTPEYLPNYITKGLEYHGYFRSGYGVNSRGGKMQAFQAPDALAKYRLGNEQETYIESIFVNKNWNPDPRGITLLSQIRVAYTTQENQTSDDLNQVDLREMYGQMGNFVEWDPGIKVWAGQRFCRLPELDINDFWWYDLSGYGGGFENINIFDIGKLDVTFIGYASNDVLLRTQRGRLSKENLNLKLDGIDVPYGKGMLWVNGGFVKGGIDHDAPTIKWPDLGGVDVGAMHYIPGELNNNQFAVQYGCGACTSLSAGGEGVIPPDLDMRNSWRVRITDMLNRQINDKLCIQCVGVYQYTYTGDQSKNGRTWVSFGCRPIFAFTKHVGFEIEPGVDYINNPARDYDTCLFKLTGGIRFTPGVIFNSRPAFRLFATYARWGDGFRGNPMLGGDAFVSQQEGMNYGIQCENWW